MKILGKAMEKKYRPNVAAVILSPKYPMSCEYFIAQRSDIKGAWQFPQGGIDKGETPRMAILRELKEEIGTDNVEIIAMYPDWLSYDFPAPAQGKMAQYAGQKQKYFLVKLKDIKDININTEIPEFNEFCFVKGNEVFKYVRSFKKEIYHKVFNYFKKEGYIC